MLQYLQCFVLSHTLSRLREDPSENRQSTHYAHHAFDDDQGGVDGFSSVEIGQRYWYFMLHLYECYEDISVPLPSSA
jgi:hypothetical protein